MSKPITYGRTKHPKRNGRGQRLCRHRYCRTLAAPGRTECHKHRKRRMAKKHPYPYHYNLLKQNAKRREIPFDLTLAEFKKIWQQHPDKWKKKARWGTETRWQMDRVDPRKGYEAGNIQIIKKRKNIMKYHNHDKFVLEVKWTKTPEGIQEETPF